jgi:outer membrane lipoprotein LolB
MSICLTLSGDYLQTKMVSVRFLSLALLFALGGCSVAPVVRQDSYAAIAKQHLQALQSWKLEARMSITSPDDSWSANVDWQRKVGEDNIELSGLFGQGAAVIHVGEHDVSIDRGDGKIQHSDNPDQFVKEQLGLFVPVRALAYWVIGLPAPMQAVDYAEQGFIQAGWQVEYKEWQPVKGQVMPRKVTATYDKIKLKLVCDAWVIDQ